MTPTTSRSAVASQRAIAPMFESHLPTSMPTTLTIVPNARPIRDAPMKYGALAEYPVQRLPPA